MMKKPKKEEPVKSNRKKIIFLLIVIIIAFVLLFGAKIYLWASLLLGNDIIIKLIPDKENIFLVNGQSEQIQFESSVLTSPFCTVLCSFNFMDLSEKKIIEKGSFNIKPAQPISKTYEILAPLKGTGQKIFRFDIYCKSKPAFFCSTEGELESKSSLITLNYELNSGNKKLKNNTRDRIVNLMQESGQINNDLDSLNETSIVLSNFLELTNSSENIKKIKNYTYNFNNSLIFLKEYWEKGDFDLLLSPLDEKEKDFFYLTESFYLINSSILFNLSHYNSLIDILNEIEYNLRDYQKLNFTNKTILEFNNLINNFNNLTENFNKSATLLEKEISVNNLRNETETMLTLIKQSEDKDLLLKSVEIIGHPQLIKINFTKKEFLLNISFKEPESQCCLFGECKEYCNNSCYYDPSKFPIIFLHGHDFSKQASAESNLNKFYKIQRNLEKDNYLDAGTILLSSSKKEEKGILGKTFYPISLKASYYFDIFKTQESTTVLQTKKDNIDTYAIRLKDIINEVKYKTDRQKVIIVAYSLGGLVARRYLQIFGENNVEKLILIGTPNHGVRGNVLTFCSIFGEEAECNDMNENSLFMNKLNTGENPIIPVYNIIGLGCNMDGETGDGIVRNSSAYLEYAENYFVDGKCETLKPFHTELLFPEKYPEVYNLLVKSLEQNSSITL